MRFVLPLWITLVLLASGAARPLKFKATIQPLPTENLVGPCVFELSIPSPAKRVRAVWITYDRGYDITRYYSDAEVNSFARRQSIALILAHQCPAKSPPTGEQGEMDMDLSRGVARSIFASLDDFSRQSRHAELSSAKLIVMGFSGIGAMFGHFIQYAPDRVLAAILANPGQTDPYGMKEMNFHAAALAVPQFVIAGGVDDRSGTQRPYDYFLRHRAQGAPWVFLVQNGISHCCVINAKTVILEWLDEIIKLRKPASDRPLRTIAVDSGWSGFIRSCESDTKDQSGEPLWNVCDSLVQRANLPMPPSQTAAAWLPTYRLAQDWLLFIRERHPANSFPDGKDALHSQFAPH